MLHINDAPQDRSPYERTDAERQEPMATRSNVAFSLLFDRKAHNRNSDPPSAQPTIERIRSKASLWHPACADLHCRRTERGPSPAPNDSFSKTKHFATNQWKGG